MNITELSKEIFKAYAKDAGNWAGEPMVGGNVRFGTEKEDRGNLTQLKRAGLITTFVDEGDTFIQFTEAGREYAKGLGVEVL